MFYIVILTLLFIQIMVKILYRLVICWVNGLMNLVQEPKSYYYETNTGKETIKVKGFTLHHKNMEKINGKALEKLVDCEVQNITVKNTQIKRDVETKNMINKEETKTLSFNLDKRIINKDFDTVPYGYISS